jgi:hypothetical protein
MQLPDEAIGYQYQGLVTPGQEEWTAAAELRNQHFLSPSRLRESASTCGLLLDSSAELLTWENAERHPTQQ